MCRLNTAVLRTGEILEKATRVLTDEEKALLETEFVGKNGQRRKLEVRPMQDPEVVAHKLMNIFFSLADDHGSPEA